jgi:hypothetical protein
MYYSSSGYLTVDAEGAFNFQVSAVGSPIAPGAPVYAQGGVYDPASGVLYSLQLTNQAAGGRLVGLAETPLAAGQTGVVRVSLKNCIS